MKLVEPVRRCNLFGAVGNGPFSYGPITQMVVGSFTIQSATVLGPLGALSINDVGWGII